MRLASAISTQDSADSSMNGAGVCTSVGPSLADVANIILETTDLESLGVCF
jgi:hypothetical protein